MKEVDANPHAKGFLACGTQTLKIVAKNQKSEVDIPLFAAKNLPLPFDIFHPDKTVWHRIPKKVCLQRRSASSLQANLFWNAVPNGLVGVEYVKGKREVFSGKQGDIDLALLIFRYDF